MDRLASRCRRSKCVDMFHAVSSFPSPVDPSAQVVRFKRIWGVYADHFNRNAVLRESGDDLRSYGLHGFLVVLCGFTIRDGSHPNLFGIPV